MPWISFVGVVVSAVLFVISLWRHADRGSWRDLAEVAGYNWWPVLLLLMVGFFIRGRTILHVAAGWFSGYFLSIAVVFLILDPTGDWLGDDSRWQSAFLVPVTEEAAKALPLLILYFTVRRRWWMKPTITDFAVYGLAVGGGFAFHEDALLARVLSGGWHGWGLLFPAMVQEPVFAVGHGVWTGLVGLGVGVAMARRGRPLAWLIPAAAYALVVLDHALVNDGSSRSALLDGRLPLYLLIAGIAAALTTEMRVLTGAVGGLGNFRSGIGRRLQAVRQAGGPVDFVRQWQHFVLFLRVMVQRMWSAETHVALASTGPAIALEDKGLAQDAPRPAAEMAPDEDDRTVVPWIVGAVVAVAALIFWFVGIDGAGRSDEPDDRVEATETTSTGSESGVDIDGETSPLGFGDGLVINTSLLLRWEQESDRGVGDDTLMVIDGDRELKVEGSVLQYRDGDLGVLCFEVGTDNVSCVAQPASGTLTAGLDIGVFEVPDLAGASAETREIAGREAFCVFAPMSEDLSVRTCSDTETGILLLIETTGKTLTGQDTFVTRELVEWSTPDEIDFALIPEAQAALDEISPGGG
jgi:RsiW-degrading membrane proteinase PrsW (M82 family)